MRVFWGIGYKNVGDVLTPVILEHFTKHHAEYVGGEAREKLIMIGSLLHEIKFGDTILGTGSNRPELEIVAPEQSRFLAIRGPLSRDRVVNADIPMVYGDPAILLPMVFRPDVEPKYELGILPHYADKPFVEIEEGQKFIDVENTWTEVVRDILACKKIISSSLHGIILAEAYGIPAVWVSYGNRVAGGDFKFQDYFLGTGRPHQARGFVLDPIPDLAQIQDGLIKALEAL